MKKPKDAATVILIRPGQNGPECFLVRRHQKSAFMGGAYVFPGGKLDDADCDAAMQAYWPSEAYSRATAGLRPTPGTELSSIRAAGLYTAAIRETFEEAGVLLACQKDGTSLSFDGERAERFAGYRRALQEHRVTFSELLASEDLYLDFDSLVYWAHWVTPSAEPRRYDTRFFVARMPEDQTASFDERETTDQAWMTPQQALLAHHKQDIFLPPPTQRNLEELASHKSWETVARQMEGRPVPCILPKVIGVDDGIAILLPWDPDFEAADGDSLPDMKVANPHPNLPTRIMVLSPS